MTHDETNKTAPVSDASQSSDCETLRRPACFICKHNTGDISPAIGICNLHRKPVCKVHGAGCVEDGHGFSVAGASIHPDTERLEFLMETMNSTRGMKSAGVTIDRGFLDYLKANPDVKLP